MFSIYCNDTFDATVEMNFTVLVQIEDGQPGPFVIKPVLYTKNTPQDSLI